LLDILRKIKYILPKGDSAKIIILFILMIIAAGLEVAGIGMIPAFVAVVASPERVFGYEPVVPLLSFLNITSNDELLIWGSGALVAIFIIKSCYVTAFNYLEARYIYNRRYKISDRLMRSYMHAPYIFHLQRNTAELLRNITQEVAIVVKIVLTDILILTKEGIMIISIVLFLFYFEPLITLIIISMAGIGVGSFLFLTQKKVKAYGLQEQGHRKNMIKAINQGLGGIKDARVLNREEEFTKKFSIEAYKSSRLLTYIKFIQQIPKPVVETTAVVGMMGIAALMVWQGRSMSTIIPVLTLFAMATVRLMPSIQQISKLYTNLRYNLVAVDPIFEDLKELEDSESELLEDRKKDVRMDLDVSIDASEIYFRYPGSDEFALDGLSFTIPKGKAVAFVGSSGAGKTTVVDMLLGLLKPEKGMISVDGKDVFKNLSAWQRSIGYIPQSIYLADETLRNNIAFGVPEKEVDDEKVLQALKLAQLGNLLKTLPLGLDTILGENGTRLSGGQRQRVGIARALYHDPEVLVMDEATSALDNITEKEITNAIEALKGERTIIIIAHRLTTVMNCNKLFLMEEGKIVEEGTYSELIDSSIQFREMALEA
jgi:ATP-binding cassette, subfamily B, bacterial PglK